MTWVVGANTIFGQGLLVSDIRVTLGENTHHDILRKVYEVGPKIIAGFAGSVRAGFLLIEDLVDFLRLDEGETDIYWHPEIVASEWKARAHKIFKSLSAVEQEIGVDILFVGTEEYSGGINGFRSVTCKLSSSDFEPVVSSKMPYFDSIGSGTNHTVNMNYLKSSMNNFSILQAEISNPGGFAKKIGSSMALSMMQHGAIESVSTHLNISIVNCKQITHHSIVIDESIAESDDRPNRNSELATSFESLCLRLGLSAEEASSMRA